MRGFNKLQTSLSHWGATEYIVLSALWLALTNPMYLLGWGLFSILSLPLFLLIVSVITYSIHSITKSTTTEIIPNSDVNLIYEGVKVTVLDGPYLDQGNPTNEAVKYYSSIIQNLDTLKGFAAQKLLAGYNENWLDEEVGQINENKFKELVFLESLVIFDEIGFAITHFNDGNLFGEHSIEISIENGVPKSVDIVG